MVIGSVKCVTALRSDRLMRLQLAELLYKKIRFSKSNMIVCKYISL